MGSTGAESPNVNEIWELKRINPLQPLEDQVANAKVLIPTNGLVNAEVIAAAPKLRLIAQPAAGYANIDLQAAKQQGVPVTRAPGLNNSATAEVALMMMLMLMRKVDEAREAFQNRIIGEPIANELCGKTLGIVGLGLVGRCLETSARALGMSILSTTSNSSRQEFEHLLQQSDVVSLHCPMSPSTQGLMGRAELALMKPGAVLINTARGGVIDKAALWESLQQGKLGGVGLDVQWQEPADPSEPLFRHPKVLALPHMGSSTEEVYQRFAEILCENIIRAREGRQLLNRLDEEEEEEEVVEEEG
eukprot:gene13454-13580_t